MKPTTWPLNLKVYVFENASADDENKNKKPAKAKEGEKVFRLNFKILFISHNHGVRMDKT